MFAYYKNDPSPGMGEGLIYYLASYHVEATPASAVSGTDSLTAFSISRTRMASASSLQEMWDSTISSP